METLSEYVLKDFGKLLKKNALEVRRTLQPTLTDCFRVYDRNLEDIPVTVDVYGKFARITDYGEEALSDENAALVKAECVSKLYVQADRVHYFYKPKRTGREQPDASEYKSFYTNVAEGGLRFKVDLSGHIDTGLFLDNVYTRSLIRDLCEGMDVLNLFCYTGSYSVYAASGGARSVTSVDLSQNYLDWAKENMEANGFSGENYSFIREDVLKFIREKGKKYDIVIFDPPSFSNSRMMEKDFDISRDWKACIECLYSLTRENAIVLFQSNLSAFVMDKRALDGWTVKEITASVKAPGFTKKVGRSRSWILEKKDKVAKDGKKPYAGKSYGKKSYGDKPYSKSRYGEDRYTDEREERRYREVPYGEKPYGRSRSRDERDSYEGRSYSEGYSVRHESDRYSRNYGDERRSERGGKSYSKERSYSRESDYRRSDEDRTDGYRRGEGYGRSDGTSRFRSKERRDDRYEDRSRPERGYEHNSPRREHDYESSEHAYGKSYGKNSQKKPVRKTASKGPRPYGYDKFGPSEGRDRDTAERERTFFWLQEDDEN